MIPAKRIDFASMMEPVALRLLGEPLEKHQNGNEWRYRSRGSLKIDIAKGTWHDFEANIGGGLIEFIARENGCDHESAIAWLKREGIIETPAIPQNPLEAKKGLFVHMITSPGTTRYSFNACDLRIQRPSGIGAWAQKMANGFGISKVFARSLIGCQA